MSPSLPTDRPGHTGRLGRVCCLTCLCTGSRHVSRVSHVSECPHHTWLSTGSTGRSSRIRSSPVSWSPSRAAALHHGAFNPVSLPGLLSVQGAAVPVVAGLEVVRLADTPAQAPSVPEEDPVLVRVDIYRPVGGPAHPQGVGVEVLSVTFSKVRITHFQKRTFWYSPA